MITKPLILIIDDETAILHLLQESLQDEQYRVVTLDDGNKALACIGNLIPDLILLDIFMPNCNGLELLAQIKKEYPQQKVLIISGYGNIPIAIEAIKKGALDFIEKPLNLDDILNKIAFLKDAGTHIFEKTGTQPHNFKDFGIIGESNLFAEFMQQIQCLAPLKYPLLIYGNSGTGKSLISNYLHSISPQKDFPFITIDGLTKPQNLFQKTSELEAGTIYLKNIHEFSVDAQTELICYLESSSYQEKNTLKNIKIIASSTTPLFKLCNEQKFNVSLFHKFNITPIELVSLNKRRYDIPLLIEHFLNKANEKNNKSIHLDIKSIRMLRNRTWHANVAELKYFIEKIVDQTPENYCVINAPKLQQFLSESETPFVEEQSFLHFSSFADASATFERNFLTYSIKKNRFDLQQVCEHLKMSHTELQDRINKLKIEIPQR